MRDKKEDIRQHSPKFPFGRGERDHIKKHFEKCDSENLLDGDEFDIGLLKNLMKGFLKIIILWMITKERIHGYEIIKKMKEGVHDKETEIDFEGPGPNKIYPILHELEKKNLIVGDWELQGKRKVKYYEASKKGINTIKIMRIKPHKNVPPILKEFWKDVIVTNKHLDNDLENNKVKKENEGE